MAVFVLLRWVVVIGEDGMTGLVQRASRNARSLSGGPRMIHALARRSRVGQCALSHAPASRLQHPTTSPADTSTAPPRTRRSPRPTQTPECRQQAQLWATWYTVVAELTRTRLGTSAQLYDDWTRARVNMIESAYSVLSDRGIELPSLD